VGIPALTQLHKYQLEGNWGIGLDLPLERVAKCGEQQRRGEGGDGT